MRKKPDAIDEQHAVKRDFSQNISNDLQSMEICMSLSANKAIIDQ